MQDDRLGNKVEANEPCTRTTCLYYGEWRLFQRGDMRQLVAGTRGIPAEMSVNVLWCLACKEFRPFDLYRQHPDAEDEASTEDQPREKRGPGRPPKKKDHDD